MKRIVLSFSTFIFVALSAASCSSDDNNSETIVQTSELPSQSKSFLETYFLGYPIVQIQRDARSVDEYYEVRLTDGTQVDFDKDGMWTEVDGNGRSLPTSFIHANIVTYVNSNYPSASIESIGKEIYGFNVDLTNNLNLRFSGEGIFLGIEN